MAAVLQLMVPCHAAVTFRLGGSVEAVHCWLFVRDYGCCCCRVFAMGMLSKIIEWVGEDYSN
jgi:hypothetical protein